MTKNIDLNGPVEVKQSTMTLDEQVACIRRKNYNEMQELLNNFRGLDSSTIKEFEKTMSKKNEDRVYSAEEEGNSLVKHNRYLKFLGQVLAKKCKRCDCIKPPASHHCSTCGRCIARMDHHCPWVNNCVGFYNQKYFLQFLVYVFLGSMHALVMMALKGWYCFDRNCAMFDDTALVVLTIVSGFLAVLFGLFVAIMFFD